MDALGAYWPLVVIVIMLVAAVLTLRRKARADSVQKQLRERHKRETSKPGRG